jgi:hypothetical protein
LKLFTSLYWFKYNIPIPDNEAPPRAKKQQEEVDSPGRIERMNESD